MAVKTDGTVYINTEIDSDGFNSGVKSMQSGIGNLSKSLKRLGVVIGSVFAIRELVQFGKEAIELGSNLQEVQNVVDVTFTKMSDKVDDFARNAAKSAGLSETMAKRYVGTFGAMAKSFGFIEEDALKMSTSLTQLSGDVASFYNLTQDEAYTKLKSVFTGETESLKDLGVVMTQTALDQFALQKGLGKTTKQMSEQEKVALRYSFVMEQLAGASGDFIRTSDGWANQTRILRLNIESLKANVGQGLINLFTPLLQVLNALIERLVIASQKFKEFTDYIFGTQTQESVSDGLDDTSGAYDDTADSIDGYSDATEAAVKSTKKMLSSFDELNLLTSGLNEELNGFNDGLLDSPSDYELNTIINPASLNDADSILSRIGKKIKEIFKDVSEFDFASIGSKISDFVVFAFNSISELIKEIDWIGIGKKIGEFINAIDWTLVIKSAGNFLINLLNAAADTFGALFDANPIAGSIVAALALAKFSGLGSVLTEKITGAFGTESKNIVSSLASIFLTAWTGFEFGQKLAELIWPEAKEYTKLTFGEQVKLIFDSFSDGSWKGALWMMGEDIRGFYMDIASGVFDFFWDLANSAWDAFYYNFLNPLFSFFENLSITAITDPEKFSSGSWIPTLPLPPIPGLATGAVIPPNAPFMAMLGDQTNGRNLEAPEGLIRQIMRDELAQIGVNVTFDVQGDEAGIFNVTQRQAVLFTKQTGRPAYPTGG